MRSVIIIIIKLVTRSKHNRCKIAYNVHIDSDGNLMPLNIFQILFLKTANRSHSIEQKSKV